MQDLFREYYFCVPGSAKKDLPELIESLQRGNEHYKTGLKCVSDPDLSDALYYLSKLKNIDKESHTHEPFRLSLSDLVDMIGRPVYVVYIGIEKVTSYGKELQKRKIPERRSWEIVTGVKKAEDEEYVFFKGSGEWIRLEYVEVYLSEEGAPRND